MKKFALSAFAIFALIVVSFAAPTDTVLIAISTLCQGISTLLPVAAMLMVVVAAVLYAGGQMMGAETRARSNVWATAALTGAMIGILIASVGPTVIGAIYGPAVNCGTGGLLPNGSDCTNSAQCMSGNCLSPIPPAPCPTGTCCMP